MEHTHFAADVITTPATVHRDELAARLVDARDLQWRCVCVGRRLDGNQSSAIGRMFDEVYGAVAAYADLLSERISALYDVEPPLPRGATRPVTFERIASVWSAEPPVDALADVLQRFCRMASDGRRVMVQLGDPVSAMLVQEIAEVAEIWQGLLASRLLDREARVSVAQVRAPQPLVSADDHVLGDPRALVTLTEYGDFACPRCVRARPFVQALQSHFGARLRFVYRNFPAVDMRPDAMMAAEAAESVAAQGGAAAYWRMHGLLFDRPQDSPCTLQMSDLMIHAWDAGADVSALRRDLKAQVFRGRVLSDIAHGRRSGVTDTPTFFINGAPFNGEWNNLAAFAHAIRRAGSPRMMASDGADAPFERRF